VARHDHGQATRTGLVDDMIPTIDLGVFRSRKAAKVAANLVLKHWTWNIED